MAAAAGLQPLGSLCSRSLLSFPSQSASRPGHECPRSAEGESRATPLSPAGRSQDLAGQRRVHDKGPRETFSSRLCILTVEARAALKEASTEQKGGSTRVHTSHPAPFPSPPPGSLPGGVVNKVWPSLSHPTQTSRSGLCPPRLPTGALLKSLLACLFGLGPVCASGPPRRWRRSQEHGPDGGAHKASEAARRGAWWGRWQSG